MFTDAPCGRGPDLLPIFLQEARRTQRSVSCSTTMTELLSSYQTMRTRSRHLFQLLADDAYYSQPIDLRHPIVFYDGHLPGFSFNTLVKRALGGPSIDE